MKDQLSVLTLLSGAVDEVFSHLQVQGSSIGVCGGAAAAASTLLTHKHADAQTVNRLGKTPQSDSHSVVNKEFAFLGGFMCRETSRSTGSVRGGREERDLRVGETATDDEADEVVLLETPSGFLSANMCNVHVRECVCVCVRV